ncbi:MAG: histidine phosphatase family protein [Rhodospirillales bacterium]|nr:histidine phosphatase family protein [Rhodospirillales bacterium]
MSGQTVWWWVRHAPVPDADGKLNGRRDVPCDVSDDRAFQALAALLPHAAVTITSPLLRTQQTLAAIVAAGAVLADPLVEADFVEQSFGAWEGLRWAEMQQRDPAAYAAFWLDPTGNAPPGGESFAEQMQRTAAAIERLSRRFDGHDIVCVSHGGSIRAAAAHALALSPRQAMGLVIDNLSITRLSRLDDGLLGSVDAAWRADCINAPCRWIRRADVC